MFFFGGGGGGVFNSNAYTTFQKFGVCKIFHMVLWSLLKCPYYAFSNITFHAVCHVAVREQTFCKVMKLKKKCLSQLPKRGRQEFKSYSVKAVRHKLIHLHNVRPWLSFALYAVDQSPRPASSDQSQQWGLTERRGLERLILWTASHESFRNRLEIR